MQLSDKTGISCDLCGTSYRNDFTYYSYDFRLVEVYANIRPSLDEIVNSQPVFSLDVCSLCFVSHKKMVIDANSKAVPWLKRKPSIAIICDMSGATLTGTYNYYYNVVTKIDVCSDGNPYVCHGCKTPTLDPTIACHKCHGASYSKQIAVKLDKRHIEIVLSEEMYTKMVNAAGSVRKIAGEWTTKS